MTIHVRVNHIGWIHAWTTREAFEAGEASACYFDPKVDPHWVDYPLSEDVAQRLAAGELVEIEDPGLSLEP